MKVIGLNYRSHDAAAALVIDDKVVAAAEEERFNRKKHSSAFPRYAVQYCLETSGLQMGEIDRFAIFVDPRLQYKLGLCNLFQDFPRSVLFLPYALEKVMKRNGMASDLQEYLGSEVLRRSCFVSHHLAHAASAFLVSPFDESAIVTWDGRGEFETVCIFSGTGGKITKLQSVVFPHSIGYLYSAVTKYLGYKPQSDEYIVMGLAPYGKPTFCDAFRELANWDDRRGLRLNLSYFDHHYRYGKSRQGCSGKFISRFGPQRQPDEAVSQRHADIAYALQQLTETMLMAIARRARNLTGSDNLCLAGGVALNCVANGLVIEEGPFSRLFVQPAADDAGTSLGAALVASGNPKLPERFRHHEIMNPFLGPSFTDREIGLEVETARTRYGLHVERSENICTTVAQMIHEGLVVGWFQGRMEFGPRALGSRSIIAAPVDVKVRDRINAMIKYREEFRPFAPAVTEEDASSYFLLHEGGKHVYPYMLATARARGNAAGNIPAVIHVDGTARVQVVNRTANPLFWRLIDSYRRLSGIPVVLNTSLNIKGEPIACRPEDAISTFRNSGLDALAMGNYVVRKEKPA